MADQLDRLKAALADRYRIERELGSGGMATVYLAHDLKHDRQVAIKVMRAELSAILGGERFLREIRIAAKLNHPHILALYDSGEADGLLYYVMPHVEGESLRVKIDRQKQLSIDETVSLTRQVASALDYAHQQGVIHRDIKPENILLHRGEAVVADFGIALAVSAAGGDRLTGTGMSLGTPEYMSPEQVAGERNVDSRSDVYSLACVLYELLAGNPPYTASTAQAVMARHVADPVPPITTVRPGVSDQIARAIARALAKSPADRFDSAREFAAALRSEVMRTQADGPSVAVLPFANMSPDPGDEYFSDGVTEEIINAVARIPGLHVTARTSAFAFKGKDIDVREVAQKLGVSTVLEGSVRRAGRRIRITAQLINASDGYHIWSDRFDRELEDVFALQDEIANSIASRLTSELTPSSATPSKKVDLKAYDSFLRGRYQRYNFDTESLDQAIICFKDAIDKDPEFALPYACLAESYTLQSIGFAVQPSRETMPKAKAAAEQALGLDPGMAEAHLASALVAMYYEWDYPTARRSMERALDLNPNFARAHSWYECYWTYVERNYERAVASCERALRLDPLQLDILDRLGTIHYLFGHFDEAVQQFQRTLDLEPGYALAYLGLADIYVRMGMFDAAVAASEKAVDIGGRAVALLGTLGITYGSRGDETKAREVLTELRNRSQRGYVSSFWLATVHAALGEIDAAFDALERAREERDANLLYITFPPRRLGLHRHPRFDEIVKSIGLGHLLPIEDPS